MLWLSTGAILLEIKVGYKYKTMDIAIPHSACSNNLWSNAAGIHAFEHHQSNAPKRDRSSWADSIRVYALRPYSIWTISDYICPDYPGNCRKNHLTEGQLKY